jgi:hypothetical protein
MTTHLHAERVKNLLFAAPQKFKLFKPFKLFAIIGHIICVTQPAPARHARRSLEDSADHGPPSRMLGSSDLAFLTLRLHLQGPLQKRGPVELVRGGRIGNVDDVDREATRYAVVRQVGREIPGVGVGVGRA